MKRSKPDKPPCKPAAHPETLTAPEECGDTVDEELITARTVTSIKLGNRQERFALAVLDRIESTTSLRPSLIHHGDAR